jgi:hypothetical protein
MKMSRTNYRQFSNKFDHRLISKHLKTHDMIKFIKINKTKVESEKKPQEER